MNSRSALLLVSLLGYIISGCAAPLPPSLSTGEELSVEVVSPTSTLTESSPTACPFPTPTTQPELPLSYRGVQVNQTTAEQLVALLGAPTEINSMIPTDHEYIYRLSPDPHRGRQVNIYTNNGTVILVSESFFAHELEVDEETPRVAEIVERYGCPDALFMYQIGEELTGLYYGTSLLYAEEGLDVQAVGVPLALTNPIQYVSHYPPEDIQARIAAGHREGSVRVSWEEALIWTPPEGVIEGEIAE